MQSIREINHHQWHHKEESRLSEQVFNLEQTLRAEEAINCGDWTSFETLEIGDIVAGIQITDETERDFLHITGKLLNAMRNN